MQIGSNWSLTNKYKPPTSPQTSDNLMLSNSGVQSGTYLDMIGAVYKKALEQEKKGGQE